jgi:hypothetical protein
MCAEDPYYNRPAFSHGGFGLGAPRQGAGHLPLPLWAPNRLLAEHEARLVRAHHDRRVSQAAPQVPQQVRPVAARVQQRPRAFEVSAFPITPPSSPDPASASDGKPRFAFHIDGMRCPVLKLAYGEAYAFDLSHFSNLGDEEGRFTLRFFEGEGEAAAEYTRGVTPSLVPAGMPGAHLVCRLSHEAPGVLWYRGTRRAGGQVEGGLVRVCEPRPIEGARARSAGRSRPRRAGLDLEGALAEREVRVRINARLLARRDARHRAIEEVLGEGPGGHEYGGTARRALWNSRPRDPRNWTGGLPET